MSAHRILEAKGIEAGYGDVLVLQDFNFDVREGEYALIIGPNGCGKSTLLKCIAGLIKMRKGSLYFENDRIDKKSCHQRIRMGMGYLGQTDNVFPTLTVEENLALAEYGLQKIRRKPPADLVLDAFPELEKLLGVKAALLSSGMRRKLALALILSTGKRMFLLDEPTSGLAPHAASDIIETIERIRSVLSPSASPAFLVVEHNYGLFKERITRAVGMRDGKIVFDEQDTPMDFLGNEAKLSSLFFG